MCYDGLSSHQDKEDPENYGKCRLSGYNLPWVVFSSAFSSLFF